MGNLKIEELLFNLKKEKSVIWTEDGKIKIRFSNTQENIDQIKDTLTAEKQNIVEILKANEIYTPEDFTKSTIIRYGEKTAPLSYAQERMLLIEEFSLEGSAYHIPALFKLKNKVDYKGIEYAINIIVKRHHILRTTMSYDRTAQEWFQNINQHHITVEYLSCNKADFESKLEIMISKRFNLSSDYPIRATIIETDSEKFLLLTLHHIAADGWSVEIFESEMIFWYEKFLGKHSRELSELTVQYSDYAQWQRHYLKGKTLQDHLHYWKDFLEDFSTLKLPFDYQRPSKISYNGDIVSFIFSAEMSDKIKNMAMELSTTPHCILLSGLSVLLGKYSNQNDIVLGTPVANRHFPEISRLIGFFVNTVINRVRLKKNETFRQLVNRVHLQQAELQQYQDLPFQKLIEELQISRDLSTHPVFQVFFTTQNFGDFDETNSSSKYFESMPLDTCYRKEKFDLSVFVNDSREQISGHVSYSVDLFKKETISGFVNHYQDLLKILVESDCLYDAVSLLNNKEKKIILEDFNDTAAEFPLNKTIIDLFEEQAVLSPDHTALVYYGKTWTYREINKEANRLCNFLNKEYHIKANDIVGIELERSDKAVIAILAVLKAGAAYAPIDPGYPKERIDYIKEDIQSKVIIDEAFIAHFNTIKEKYSTDNQKRNMTSDDLLYVIYTSGTTGNPKGIMMRNFSMVNLICSTTKDLKKAEHIMHFANCSFDVSFQEIFTALLSGKTLYPIREHSKKDINALCLFISENQIDTLFFPTSYFKLLIENETFLAALNPGINHLILAGERLTLNEKILEKCTLHNILIHNHYGPSETHVITTYTINPHTSSKSWDLIPPIGKPISNTRIYILDDHNNPVLAGVPGNLYVSGVSLAKGYLNKEELSREKFVANPFIKGQIMYKTGDIAKWLGDGNIEFIGRSDFQVKIRGYRIEPSEIEVHILQYSSNFKQVIVETKEFRNEKILAVYYMVKENGKIDRSALREYLIQRLPEYMVPAFFVELDTIPLTFNGKIDRKSLPDISDENLIRKEYTAPGNETEKKIAEIWQEVLGIEKIGATDNFFELGGHSLKALNILHRINESFQLSFSLEYIFNFPTVGSLAEIISTLTFPASNELVNNHETYKI
ncbi:non-ribosomal peptide synthetase [Chryseobacterium gallinarum]|uniref:Amino acid adenylation domain-containing protein n=1 Tax=Chryseobacterium gallinarum TaxID=1324352 RepID=A0ABX6KSB3_CHRGL|nr:non-ribosomal peptide synthetase [Chryseobacterium gallinarum]QIY90739.1 amino acid adenylation domain-containing protein [Chryseobacterium gallinarum]